jgi:hypothetical protein
MIGVNVVLAYGADQKSVNAYGKRKLITAKNAQLFSLTVQNKSSSADFWVQVYDVTGADADAAGAAADAVEPEFEGPCQAGSFLPFGFPAGWRCVNGIYVRCVTAADGAETDLIAEDDAKITASYMDGPIG